MPKTKKEKKERKKERKDNENGEARENTIRRVVSGSVALTRGSWFALHVSMRPADS